MRIAKVRHNELSGNLSIHPCARFRCSRCVAGWPEVIKEKRHSRVVIEARQTLAIRIIGTIERNISVRTDIGGSVTRAEEWESEWQGGLERTVVARGEESAIVRIERRRNQLGCSDIG